VITAEQLRRRRLSTTYRSDGYDAAQVDLYLDLAAETLASLEAGRAGSAGAAQMLLRELRTATFPGRTSGSGYESAQVEALRAGVVAALETHVGTSSAPSALAPATVPAAPLTDAPATTLSLAPVVPGGPLGLPAPGESLGSVGTLGAVVGWGAPSGARDPLSAYGLVVQLQTARTQLLGAATDRLVLRTASGELLGVVAVEATDGGVVLTTEG